MLENSMLKGNFISFARSLFFPFSLSTSLLRKSSVQWHNRWNKSNLTTIHWRTGIKDTHIWFTVVTLSEVILISFVEMRQWFFRAQTPRFHSSIRIVCTAIQSSAHFCYKFILFCLNNTRKNTEQIPKCSTCVDGDALAHCALIPRHRVIDGICVDLVKWKQLCVLCVFVWLRTEMHWQCIVTLRRTSKLKFTLR